MKNRKIGLVLSMLTALMFFVFPVAGAISSTIGVSALVALPSAVALNYAVEKMNSIFTLNMTGMYKLGLDKEIWVSDIVTDLFKVNQFLNYAVNDDMHVLAGKIVHVPQSGTASAVVVNRAVYPATVTVRVDDEVTYTLNELTTDPRKVSNADSVQMSYDKRRSVTLQDRTTINQVAAELMLINWAPASATAVRTSGAATPARIAGQTGNRNAFVEADLRKAMSIMNAQDIPLEDRYAMLDAYMYDDLIASISVSQYRDFSQYYDAEKGILGKLHGFNIMMRSTCVMYTATGVALKAYGSVVAATDNAAALCWHKTCVRRALGDAQMFEASGDPQHYSDIISFLLRFGGRIGRLDGKGVLAISQQ